MSASTQAAPTAPAEPKAPEREPSGRKRILLVEGDGFTRLVLLFRLRLAGFRVDFTSNGIIAKEKLTSKHPDALLVELKLRGLSGLELIKAARSDPEFGDRPIYVFTNADDMNRSARKEVARLATKLFDKKEVTREDLVRALATALIKRPMFGNGDVTTTPAAADAHESTHGEKVLPAELQEIIAGVRSQVKDLAKCSDAKSRAASRGELLGRVHSLTSCADAAGLANLSRQSKALEGLLTQLGKENKDRTDAALGTVSRAVDVLNSLPADPAEKKEELTKFIAVIVDEAASSNKAMTEALTQAGFAPVTFEDPTRVRDHLSSNHVDLVVANVLLPEAHGLALEDIRSIPKQSKTPVIFVPESQFLEHSWEDLPTSAPRVDANPLLLKELTVKALNAVQSKETTPAVSPAPAAQKQPKPAAPVNPALGDGFDIFKAPKTPSSTANAPAPAPAQPAKPLTPANPALDGFELFKGPKPADESRLVQPASQTSFLALPATSHALPAMVPAGVSLPVQYPDSHPQSESGKPTILLVEDDPFVLRVYRRSLKREGFEVEVAEDGLAAVQQLPKVKPGLVILDLMLPKMHGLEVLKFIRTDANLKDTPVLVLSNAYLEALEVKANQAGANKGLRKTECTPTILIHHVCELLGLPDGPVAEPEPNLGEEALAGTDEEESFAETAIFTRQAGLRQDAPKEVVKIRQLSLSYIKATNDDERLAQLTELYRRVRFLSARAGLSGLTKIAELCSALEGLLFQIVFNQLQPTTSTYQTIAQAVDCLDRLAQNRDTTFVEPRAKSKVLVVDDDAVCNFTMVTTLKRAGFEVVGTQDPVESLRILKAEGFSLILLDVNMPGLNGFELCEQLRQLPQYKYTPVVFVTVDAEFQNRARSVMAGGNDLMGKPVCPSELIVKVTMHLLNASSQAVADPAQQPQEAVQEAEAAPESVLDAGEVQTTGFQAVEEQGAVENFASETEQPAEPGAAATEFEAESLSRLPETSTDGWQTDQESLETLQPSALQQDAPEAPQAEAGFEEQTTESQEFAAVEGDASEAVPENRLEPEAEAAPAAEELVVSMSNGAEAEESQAEEATSEPAQTSAELQKAQDEHEELTNRISKTEMELSQAKASIENRDKAIEALRNRLEALTGGKPAGEALAAKPGDEPPKVSPAEADLLANSTAIVAEAQARCDQLERELTQLRQAREELAGKLAREQQSASETNRLTQELEQRLAQNAADLERAKADADWQKQEKERAEAELRRKLETAQATSAQNEAAQKEAQTRCGELEKELVELQRTRENLNGSFAKEQQAVADSQNRIKQLERDLESGSAQLERAKGELEKHTKDRSRIESELVRQVELATAASAQSDAAQKQAQARCRQLEQELAELRAAREAATGQVAKEQHATTESRARINELEGQLRTKSTELERAKVDWEKQSKERGGIESDLRRQLETVTETSKQSETAQKQAQDRCRQLERELADLRNAREEATGQVAKEQQVNTEFCSRIKELENQFSAISTQLERSKTEWDNQAKERERKESDLQRQLEAATEAGKQSETAHKQAQDRCRQLEQDLADLRKAREELDGKFANAQKAGIESGNRLKEVEEALGKRSTELERAKADFEKQTQEHARVQADLRGQLEAAAAQAKQGDAAHKQSQARCGQLEQELAALQQTREQLNSKVAHEQEATQKLVKRIKDLEAYLDEKAGDLKRARAEQENHAKERARMEAELRRQLELANASGKQSENAQKQAQSRSSQFERELNDLRQAHEKLESKFDKEHETAQKSAKRIEELQAQLDKKAAELKRAKVESEDQAEEHSRLEAELRKQLDAANAAGKQHEAAHKKSQNWCGQLEQELSALRHAREEITGKFAKEQQVTTESRSRIKELEGQLDSRSAELQRAKADLEKHLREQVRLETELRRQLDVASAAAKQNETAHNQSRSRCNELEQELAGLRKAREEITGKFAKEQQVTTESRSRIKELEGQLESKAAELNRAKADLQNRIREQGQIETELRKQLEQASAASQQSESALKQAHSKLEQELAALRQAGEELNGRFVKEQQVSTESRGRIKELEGELESKAAELQRAKAETENHARAESELRNKLESAAAASQQNESALRQAQSKLEQELAALRKTGEELTGKFAKEQQLTAESRSRIKELEGQVESKSAELQRAKAEAENHTRAESELRNKLESAAAASRQNESALQQAHSKLEQELAALRQAGEELNGKFVKEQQASNESRSRIKELEGQLDSKSAEAQRAKAELENQLKERSRVESELRRQLDSVMATGKQNETALQQTQARLEQELAVLRQAREELNGKFTKEQQATAASSARIKELEGHLDSKSSELDRVKADFENHAKERASVEVELRKQLEAAAAAGAQNETALKQAQTKLEQDLAVLRQAREELNGRLAKEQHAAAEARGRINELEKRLHSTEASRSAQVGELEQRVAQGVAALSRVTADLAKEQGERQRSEQRAATLNTELQQLHVKFSNLLQTQQTNLERISALEEKLVQSGHALARRTADFEHLQAESRLALEQLENAKGLNLQLRKNLSHFEAANKTFDKTRQDLQSRLDASLSTANETGAKLQRESVERQRLSETLAAVQQALQEQSQKGQRLQAELQATLEARRQSEAKLRKETDEHHALANTLAAVQRELQEQSQKRQVFETELESARKVLSEVEAKLQTEATERQRLAAALDGVQRELQTQTRKGESLETELRTSLENVRGAEARLQKEAAERQHFAETLDKVQQELQAQTRKRETLELEHRTTVGRLHEHEAGLQKEITERYRLTEALESTRRNLQDRTQRSELELSKLQSALQFEQLERKRQEIQNARMRHFALEAARAARVQRNNLRRQIRESVENLCQSTRQLLALPMSEQQKKLAEAVLQDGLAVQSRMREADMSPRMSVPSPEGSASKLS